jgi:hypothetical protein
MSASCGNSNRVRTLLDRYMEKLGERTEGGCVRWLGSMRHGYGAFWIGGQMEGAHRASWLLSRGPIPPGMHVLHTCDNRWCTAIEHLYLGTNVENGRDRAERDRHRRGTRVGDRGQENGNSKLVPAQVLEIRALYSAGGFSQRQLAKRFSVTQPQIGYIVRREQWAHL